MIAAFDLPQIGRSPARFDFAKLESLNGHYMRTSADADLVDALDRLLPYLPQGAEIAKKLTPGGPPKAHGGHAGPQGPGQNPGRPD